MFTSSMTRRPAYARLDLSEQLGQLSRRRHGRAVSDARREPASGAARRCARAAQCTQPVFTSCARDRPHASRSARQVSRRYRQSRARSRQSRRVCMPVAAHRSRRAWRLRAAARTTTSSRSKRSDANGAPIYHTNVLMSRRHALRGGLLGIHSRGRARAVVVTRCVRLATRSST